MKNKIVPILIGVFLIIVIISFLVSNFAPKQESVSTDTTKLDVDYYSRQSNKNDRDMDITTFQETDPESYLEIEERNKPKTEVDIPSTMNIDERRANQSSGTESSASEPIVVTETYPEESDEEGDIVETEDTAKVTDGNFDYLVRIASSHDLNEETMLYFSQNFKDTYNDYLSDAYFGLIHSIKYNIINYDGNFEERTVRLYTTDDQVFVVKFELDENQKITALYKGE